MLRGALTAASVLFVVFCGGPGAHVGLGAATVDWGIPGSPNRPVVAPDAPLDCCTEGVGRLFYWSPNIVLWFKGQGRGRLFDGRDFLAQGWRDVLRRLWGSPRRAQSRAC